MTKNSMCGSGRKEISVLNVLYVLWPSLAARPANVSKIVQFLVCHTHNILLTAQVTFIKYWIDKPLMHKLQDELHIMLNSFICIIIDIIDF